MHWLLVGGGLPLLAVVLVRVAQEVPSRGAPAAATDDDEGLTCFISICSLLMADCWMESSLRRLFIPTVNAVPFTLSESTKISTVPPVPVVKLDSYGCRYLILNRISFLSHCI